MDLKEYALWHSPRVPHGVFRVQWPKYHRLGAKQAARNGEKQPHFGLRATGLSSAAY